MSFRKKKLATDTLESTIDTDDESCSTGLEIGVTDLRLSELFDRINLQAGIEELPEGYEAMFFLHDVHGYNHNAITKMRWCSVGSSKSQLHKAQNDCLRSCAVATLAPNEATVDGTQCVLSK